MLELNLLSHSKYRPLNMSLIQNRDQPLSLWHPEEKYFAIAKNSITFLKWCGMDIITTHLRYFTHIDSFGISWRHVFRYVSLTLETNATFISYSLSLTVGTSLVYVHMCVCVYACVCMYMCVCSCSYMHVCAYES